MEKLRLVEKMGYYSIQTPILMHDTMRGISLYWVNLIHDIERDNVENIFKEYCDDLSLAKYQLKILEIHDELMTVDDSMNILEEFYY